VLEAPTLDSSPDPGGYGLLGCSVLVPVEDRLSRPVIARAGEAECRVAVVRGDVPGVQLGADPANRHMSERVIPPPAVPAELCSGQAHRPLLPSGRGGGPVVVVAATRHQEDGKAVHRAKGSSEHAARLDGRRSPVNTGAPLPDSGSGYFTANASCTSGQPLVVLMESRMRGTRKSGSEGGGEQTTG
jgi:hypothetical protein